MSDSTAAPSGNLAEDAKRLGNEAFAKQAFDEAIAHYSEAIRLDPENAVYYSNRSACYASKKDWKQAQQDAAQCVAKDPSFIKGYYRLATAQTELGLFDDAIATLTAGIAKEPENDQLAKQLKTVRSKKAAAVAKAKRPQRNLDEAQRKELQELQENGAKLMKDLRQVNARLTVCQRELRANQVTTAQIQPLPAETTTYRALGKCFMHTPRKEVDRRLSSELESLTKTQSDLTDRKQYLERRIESNAQHMKDIVNQ